MRCRWPPDSSRPSSPTGVSTPCGRVETQSQMRARLQRLLDLAFARAGTPERNVVPDARREQMRVLAGERDRPADVLLARSRADPRRRGSRGPARGRGSAAAGWPPWSFRRRSARRAPPAHPARAAGSAVRAPAAGGLGSARATSSSATANGQAGSGIGDAGSATVGLLIDELQHPAARPRASPSALGQRSASGLTASNDASASRPSIAIRTGSRLWWPDAKAATASTPATVNPVIARVEAVAIAGGERIAAPELDQRRDLPIARGPGAVPLGAEHHQSRALPASNSTSSAASVRARAATAVVPARAADAAGERGNGGPGDEQAGREHQPRGGQHSGRDADRTAAARAAPRGSARARADRDSAVRRRPRPCA